MPQDKRKPCDGDKWWAVSRDAGRADPSGSVRQAPQEEATLRAGTRGEEAPAVPRAEVWTSQLGGQQTSWPRADKTLWPYT